MNWFKKVLKKNEISSLEQGLEKSNRSFFQKLSQVFVGKRKIDEQTLDQLEEILIASDVGVDTTVKIVQKIEQLSQERTLYTEDLNQVLQEVVNGFLKHPQEDDIEQISHKKPYVIMVVGVNGVGKTTTIGKLAYRFKQAGLKVVLGAGDTFRAAAIDQLSIWAERIGVPIVKQQMGADPASVAYDTIESAIAQQADVVLIDTAGRLHNKINLMNELSKIKRVMQKHSPEAPHQVLLVLDGSTGQNAFEQTKQFTQATEVDSLAITKLDGTAKGGVVIGISDQFQIPVKYIGIGEGLEDLQSFHPKEFVSSFFKQH